MCVPLSIIGGKSHEYKALPFAGGYIDNRRAEDKILALGLSLHSCTRHMTGRHWHNKTGPTPAQPDTRGVSVHGVVEPAYTGS